MAKSFWNRVARKLDGLRFRRYAGSLRYVARNNSRLVVYPSHRIMFNRVKKSGNSSVLLFMQEATGQAASETSAGYRADKARALEGLMHPFDLPKSELLRIRDYYVFTIVRNPYSRCLSAFLQKVAPGTSDKYQEVPGFGHRDPDGFSDYVGFLEDGGLYTNPHFWPQVDLLFFPPEHFSFIGRLERLEKDLGCVLEDNGLAPPAGSRLDAPHPSEAAERVKVTGATDKVEAYYTSDLVERVRALYPEDFALGGYDPASTSSVGRTQKRR